MNNKFYSPTQEKYSEELQKLAKESENKKIPDQVHEYTHDVHGKKLPCKFIQMNKRLYAHIEKIFPFWINNEYDYFGLCFGYPGGGKSHLFQRISLLLNADFSLKDIVFTPDQFDEWISKAPRGAVCIYDESDVMSEHHSNNILLGIKRNLKRIRTKGLIIFFVTTNMKDMKDYFASRARMCMYVKIDEKNPANRGYINLWHSQDLISDLFAKIKKAYSENSRVYESAFSTLKNVYVGRKIPDDWPIDKVAYEDKKEAARKTYEEDRKLSPKRAVLDARNKFIVALEKFADEGFQPNTHARKGKIFGVERSYYSSILREAAIRDGGTP